MSKHLGKLCLPSVSRVNSTWLTRIPGLPAPGPAPSQEGVPVPTEKKEGFSAPLAPCEEEEKEKCLWSLLKPFMTLIRALVTSKQGLQNSDL